MSSEFFLAEKWWEQPHVAAPERRQVSLDLFPSETPDKRVFQITIPPEEPPKATAE